MKNFIRTDKYFPLICFLLLCMVRSGYSQTDMIDSNKIDWEKIYSLVVTRRLPELDAEKEREILGETDRILLETKSIYSAYDFLISKVAENNGKRYLVFGNKKIKEKLVELFKMERQCQLKEAIQTDWKDSILSRRDISEEAKKEVLEKIEKEKELMKSSLNYLVSKDGDLCLDCYIHDPELKKLLTPPPGQEDEFEPEGVYYNIEAFYSVALSTFLPGMYDYLWISIYTYVEKLPYYPQYFYIVKVYPKEFLDDISRGFVEGTVIYRKEGEGFRWEDVFNIIGLLTEYNASFVEQEKNRIKKILGKHFEDLIVNTKKDRNELLLQVSINDKKDDKDIYESMLRSTFEKELAIRKNMLEIIYQRIGEKEDIENIKKLAEDIPLDYPVRESNREWDERQKERYLQRVKELQDRVKVLVEKLSQQ